jgi:hypothetical protein
VLDYEFSLLNHDELSYYNHLSSKFTRYGVVTVMHSLSILV